MIHSDADLRRILQTTRTVAVLGAHADEARAAHYVPEYLAQVGYRIVPVNPVYVGRRLFGEDVRATLSEIDERVDMVDVFRRPEALADHVDDLLAMQPLPAVVWLQLGIRNDEVATRLRIAGIDVVQDRCTLAEHRRLAIPGR